MAKVLYPKTSDPVQAQCPNCKSSMPHDVACGQFVLGSAGEEGPYWLEYSLLQCQECHEISVREEVVTG